MAIGRQVCVPKFRMRRVPILIGTGRCATREWATLRDRPGSAARLEDQAQCDLHLAWIAYRRGDGANSAAPNGGIWLPELRVVEDVERLGSELYGEAFEGPEVLEERGIQIGPARAEQDIAARIAINERSRRGESRRVEPAAE